jgi:O-succinylbenzoic acid--CoA ligase
VAESALVGLAFDPSVPAIDWEGRDCLAVVNPEWRRREPDEVARVVAALPPHPGHLWMATSGSTASTSGSFRFVALSREAFLASASAVNAHLQSSRDDVWIHALPMFHVGGLGILARARLSGATVAAGVVGRWDAFRFRARAGEVKATLTALVPAQLHDLVGAGLRAPASLRAAVIGGGRLDPELCRDARQLGWPCLPSYGMTETCSQIATASLTEARAPGCGPVLPLLPHAQARVNDERRLEVRATSLLTAYAEVTSSGVREWNPLIDGWLETEDLGRLHAGGIEVLGRATDSVKVLGETVALAHVDAVLARWIAGEQNLAGATVDSAVVALPHPRRGHELVGVLASDAREQFEPRTAALAEAFDAAQREALLPYERVQRLAWVNRIPRTSLGKCQRALLTREMLLELGTQR